MSREQMKARLEGLTDLCPEHLRQGIRHLQRNCDIECSVHEDDTSWDACKQPDRYDGDRMAQALADSPRLHAALDAVESVCADWEKLADGDRYYASRIRAAIKTAIDG